MRFNQERLRSPYPRIPDVGGQHRSRYGCESPGHDCVDLGVGHDVEVGLDGEGGLALAEEDVGGRGEGLAGGGADGHLHGGKV